MTAKAALCKALLKGHVLNVKNCFELIGLTNCAREIGRMIERDFDVTVDRKQMEGKSRYGQPITWVNYKLNNTDQNKPGMELMREYVREQEKNTLITTTKQLKQLELL